MDTSETYINMCNKAEEIQANWKPKEWDYIYGERDYEKQVLVLSGYCTDSGFYGAELEEEHHGKRDIVGVISPIWLPRQDQLQEMLDYKYTMSPVKELARWLENLHAEEYLSKLDWSCEQLWMVFVMEKLHNKSWDGETWTR